MALKEYRAKRNFRVTSEPKGKIIKPGRQRRFVVHKHDASRLHYDLRLEIRGALVSWAVPKGPTLDPAEKRLAAMTEDHPIAYGDYEGVIPEGSYGAGPSMLWDDGIFTVEGDDTPEEQLEKGELKLVMLGQKLKGAFVLVKMKARKEKSKGNEWLLIKRRDPYAVEGWNEVEEGADRSVKTGRTMDEIRGGRKTRKRA
jgi:bifunctional non-homologous end joining protein LigD